MHESFWGTFIISVGVIIIALIFFMQRVTNSNEQLNTLVKETANAAMWDAFDYHAYTHTNGETIRINREAFIESFVRRFSQNASIANTYTIEFYDINEYPPKVSIKVKTKESGVVMDEQYDLKLTSQIDAILETAD